MVGTIFVGETTEKDSIPLIDDDPFHRLYLATLIAFYDENLMILLNRVHLKQLIDV